MDVVGSIEGKWYLEWNLEFDKLKQKCRNTIGVTNLHILDPKK